MTAPRLTPAQREALRLVAEGQVARQTTRTTGHVRWFFGAAIISPVPFRRLNALDLIQVGSERLVAGSQYRADVRVTAEGLRVLDQIGGGR